MKKTFALALCLIVMLSALPTTALADNGFAIEGPADGYTYESGVLKFTKSGTYKISMAGGVTSTTDHIEINGSSIVSSNTSGAAQDITLVLSDLTMVTDDDKPNIHFVNSSSEIKVCFDIRGTNSITNTKSATSNWVGYCIGSPTSVYYTVIGSGSLTLTSKRSSKWDGRAFTLNSKDVALTLNNCSIDMWTRMNINAGTLEINSTEDCIMFSTNATGFTMTGGHVILNSSKNAGIWYNIKNNVPNFTMEGGTLTIRFGGSYGIVWTKSNGQRMNISGGEIEIGERASASVLIGNATNHSFASEYAHKNYILSTDNKLTEIPDTSVFNATGGLHSYYRYLLITPTDKIEYDLNGGEYKKADGTAGENPNPVTYSRVDSFTLINPTRDGYNFTGWTGSNGSTPETSVTVNGSNGLGKKTYTANWELIEYEVTINSGEHMTKTTDSGTASQSVTYGSAMTNVVYTANDGYYFPEDYAVAPVNGISVTRIDYSQIKVSGSPTADASITLTAATAKTKEATPGAEFEATGADCGTLTKVTSGMKYSIDGGTTWTDITGTTAAIASGVNTSNGIQVYQPGNGTTTVDSDKQTITVTKAATPNLAATQPATIGGTGSIPTTTEYQQSTDGTAWTDCTGAWSDLAVGTYYVRVKASGTTLASDAQTITISEYTPGKETTPSATFTATGADSGTLTNVTSGMKYSIDGGATWIDIGDATVAIPSGVNTTNGIQVYQPGNGTTTVDSDKQTITVSKAATPNLAPTQPATIGGTGSIPTTADHQQSTDGTAWEDCTGEMSGLAAGTYYVRVKASGATLASDAQKITISAYDPGKETTPAAVFEATGPDTGVLSGLEAGAKYTLSGVVSNTFTASGDKQELTGVAPGTLSIVKNGDGSTTLDSDPQEISITKAKTPTAPTAVECATAGNNDGKLCGVAADMEYRKSDATAWTAGTGSDITGLTPGTYLVRVRAAGTMLASETLELTVAAYTAPDQVAAPTFNLPAGTYSSAQNVTLSCGTAGATIYYTLNGDAPTAAATPYTNPITVEKTTTIRAIAIRDGMLDSAVSEAAYTISKQIGTIVVNTYDGVYDGKAHGITVSVKEPADGAVIRFGTAEDACTLEASPTITNVADSPLTVWYSVTAEGYSPRTDSATVTISKANPELTPPKAKIGLMATGEKQALIEAGQTNDGTMLYALTRKNEAPSAADFSGTVPTAADAGTYYVWYQVVGDRNHNDSETACITAKITGETSQTVTFKVVNGSWDDGTNTDKVVTLSSQTGEVLKLAATDIPAVGAKPADTYKAGAWDVVPSTETEIIAATTYTYTYAAVGAVSHTVTLKVVNGTWNDGTRADKTIVLTGGKGEELRLQFNQIPDVNKPDKGYSAETGSWDKEPPFILDGVKYGDPITKDTVYTYTYGKIQDQPAGSETGNTETKPGAPAITNSNMAKVVKSVVAAIKSGKLAGVTEQVKQALSQPGVEVTLTLVSTPLADNEIPAQDKNALDRVMQTSGYDGYAAFDLSLLMTVKDPATGETVTSYIHVSSKEVTFTLDIPDNLKKDGRTFYLLHTANGNTSVIGSAKNPGPMNGKSINFSTYAIAYKDAVATERFTFKKSWIGGKEDEISFKVYSPDGKVYDGTVSKDKVSGKKTMEWTFDLGELPVGCYVVEEPVAGYTSRCMNVGEHAADRDRCYNGGTIMNMKVPKTGDTADFALWIGMLAVGLAGIAAVLVIGKKRKAQK